MHERERRGEGHRHTGVVCKRKKRMPGVGMQPWVHGLHACSNGCMNAGWRGVFQVRCNESRVQ